VYCVLGSTNANNYYLGFFLNSSPGTKSILLISSETYTVEYSIEAPGVGYYSNGSISANGEVILNLPTSVAVMSPNDQDKGIYLTTSSDKVTVIGQNLAFGTSDSYLALPITLLNVAVYIYYGISVPRTIVHSEAIYSSILIVGTENNTMMKLTVTQPITISVGSITTTLIAGREYSFVINRLRTVYVGSLDDLTGTKIVTDKPVSVLSGHGCANVPWNIGYCSHLIEQIPPTALWGTLYYTVPLASRTSYIIKILAAYNSTIVTINCNNIMELHTINEGESRNKTLSMQEYCAIYSNKEVLVVQFSVGGARGNNYGDPMMTLVPATNHYLNKFDFSTIRNPLRSGYRHYINIIVIRQYYQPNMIYLTAGGVNRSLETQQWVPITVNHTIEAYATQVNILEGMTEIFHSDTAAQMMVIVYGFSRNDGYGHVGGFHISTGCLSLIN